MNDAIALLRSMGGRLTYRNARDVDVPLRRLRTEIDRELRAVDAYHSLPALFQATVDHYFDEWVAPAIPAQAVRQPIKTLAIRRAGLASKGALNGGFARRALAHLYRLALAESQLHAMQIAYAVESTGDAELTPDGLLCSDSLRQVTQGISRAAMGGGRVQRFANGVTERMFADPISFCEGVFHVLAGDPPRDVGAFSGTHLGDFPGADVARPFWVALGARLQLLTIARRVAEETVETPASIAILPTMGIRLFGPGLHGTTADDRAAFQGAVMEAFWQRAWLSDIAPGDEPHAFVERPATRIAWERGLFVTSAYNIADSLTMLTETAVGPTRKPVPYALPPDVFQRVLSRPLEQRVVQLFRDFGFTAGEVTDGGAWLTQDGVLTASSLSRPPGQVDVLARHPTGGVVVVECKVLALPTGIATMLSQWQKLGVDDSAGFQRRLVGKTQWALEFMAALDRRVTGLDTFLVLDRALHLGLLTSGPVVTLDFELLRERLANTTWGSPQAE